MVEAVIAAVQPGDVYVADRNFCTAKVFNGVAERAGFFVIREHAQVAVVSEGTLHARGRSESGSVFAQNVTLRLDGREAKVRRIVLRLDAATRDGDTEMAILTNLPESVDAVTVAGLYRRRWTIESMFARVERNLHSELASLGYPGAAVFGFAVALVASNVFAVVQSVLRAAQKRHAEKAITDRGPKVRRERTRFRDTPHVSTAKLLGRA